jgi:phosphoribosylamine--glycine ligase
MVQVRRFLQGEEMRVRILVVGSGGREHALCWKIRQSPRVTELFCAPGNAGIAEVAKCISDVPAEDVPGQVALARELAVDLVVVGPEAPLVGGLVDQLIAAGIPAFGPTAKAAILEGSKGFTKDLCAKYDIPTAAYGRFKNLDAARDFVRQKGAPIVVKADGLAAGKGVVVAQSVPEALAALDRMMADREFGAAGQEVVVEEFLEGEEVSFFALVDGETALPLAGAQDHKRVGDGDTGPNTGGMGAYSPAPVLTPEIERRVMDEIILPTVRGMKAEGRPFRGVLFAGLMVGDDGPKLIEFNTRFGDPECQCLMLRMESDLVPLLDASARGSLQGRSIDWRDEAALLVVMAAKGYPASYEKGSVIGGLDEAGKGEGVSIFHAGTKRDSQDRVLANGGRVLGIGARAPSVEEARARAYGAVDRIDWPDGFCRRDIAWRALARG